MSETPDPPIARPVPLPATRPTPAPPPAAMPMLAGRRTVFPTLAHAARASWPAGLKVRPADPRTVGVGETVMCGCYRVVPAHEMLDLRELGETQCAALGLPSPLLCQACFHHAAARGAIVHSAIAEALSLHGSVTASLERHDQEALARGWHRVTARNARLLVPLETLLPARVDPPPEESLA